MFCGRVGQFPSDTSVPFAHTTHSDINELVLILHELRSLLCDKAALVSHPLSRKVDDIRADPKADPAALEIAEQNFASIADVVSRCNIGAYKTRALQQIVSEKSDVGSAA